MHPPLLLGVVAIEKGAFGSPSTKVAKFTFNHEKKKWCIYFFCISSCLVIMPTSTEHGVKDSLVIRKYGTGFRSSMVEIWILKIKKVDDIHAQLMTNIWKHLLNETHIEMSQAMDVKISTISDHPKKIGKVKKLGKWVPHELGERERASCFEVCSMLFLQNSNDPFLDRIVTCNKKWIIYDNNKWLAQWLDHDEAPKHFQKLKLHEQKIMVIVWWSTIQVIHYSFLEAN